MPHNYICYDAKKTGPETGMSGSIFQKQKESQRDWTKLSKRREDQRDDWSRTDYEGLCRLW